MVHGKTVMVDTPPRTTAAQFGLLVADRTGLPLGAFGLYRESRPLRSLEGPCTIELKTRGRGGGCYASKASGSEGTQRGLPPSKQTQLPPDNALSKDDAPATSASMPARPAERHVSAEDGAIGLPLEIYTALTALDDGLVETLRAGDIRLVSSEWFLAQPDAAGEVAECDGSTLRLKEGGAFYAPSPLVCVAVHWPKLVAGAQSGELYDLEVQ